MMAGASTFLCLLSARQPPYAHRAHAPRLRQHGARTSITARRIRTDIASVLRAVRPLEPRVEHDRAERDPSDHRPDA